MVAVLAILLALLAGPAAALTAAEARLEVVLDHPGRVPYEKEMVLATVRGTYTVTINREALVLPRMRDFDWIQLTRDVWSERTEGGRRVTVVERRVAFFPQRHGPLTIRPVTHTLYVSKGGGPWHEETVSSPPVVVEVAAAPAGGGWWLPATAIELSDAWDKPPDRLGEAEAETVTRRVTLWVLGATAAMLPPQPAMREPWLITFIGPEVRSTELTPAGPLTSVIWEWTFNPRTGEPGVIPEVQLPWFDTVDRTARTVVLGAAPLGYAGFGANAEVYWRPGFRRAWVVVAAGLAGVLLTLALVAPGARVRSGRELVAGVRALLPDPAVRAMRTSARAGDAAAFRRAATACLAPLPAARRHALLAGLDAHLFGPTGRPPPDLVSLCAALRRERRAASG